MSHPPGDARRSVVGIGIATLALYGLVYAAQRRMAFGPLAFWPVALYVCATVTTFLLYARVLTLAARSLLHGKARKHALLFPVLFSASLVAAPPSLSIDVFSYLAHGYQARVGENPYAQPVKTVSDTAYGTELVRRGWIPVHGVSPYGPLWTWVEIAVGRMSNPTIQMIVVKAFVAASSLFCGLLIWTLLGSVAPSHQLFGTLLYLWNPVVVMELAAEGHNEGLIIGAALLCVLLCVIARPASGVLALGIGALVKVTALITLPPMLVYSWRRSDRHGRLVARLALAAFVVAGIGALAYAPLWLGPATFDGLRAHGRPTVLASTPGVLFLYLTRSHSPEASAQLLSMMTGATLVGVMMIVSFRSVDERSALRACALIAVAYLLLAPGYWPWYTALPIALLALTPDTAFTAAILAFSFGSRLAAPIDRLRLNGLMGWNEAAIVTTVIGLWVPLAVLLALALWRVTTSSGLSGRRWARVQLRPL